MNYTTLSAAAKAITILRDLYPQKTKQLKEDLKIDDNVLSRYDNNKGVLDLKLIDKLCNLYGIEVDIFMQIVSGIKNGLWGDDFIYLSIEYIIGKEQSSGMPSIDEARKDHQLLMLAKSIIIAAEAAASTHYRNMKEITRLEVMKVDSEEHHRNVSGQLISLWNYNRTSLLRIHSFLGAIQTAAKKLDIELPNNITDSERVNNPSLEEIANTNNLCDEIINEEQKQTLQETPLTDRVIKLTVKKRSTIKPMSSPELDVNEVVTIPNGYYATFCLRRTHAERGLLVSYFELPSGWTGTPIMVVAHTGAIDVELLAGEELGEIKIKRN